VVGIERKKVNWVLDADFRDLSVEGRWRQEGGGRAASCARGRGCCVLMG
jgi:hypothetical protein